MKPRSDKRERLLNSARLLFHQEGYRATSLGDIAKAADVPVGNVYYYFKSKEELASTIISRQEKEFEDLFAWLSSKESDPEKRLLGFVEFVEERAVLFARHGCPVGSLCQELDKTNPQLAQLADKVLKKQILWAKNQFEAGGHSAPLESGRHFIAQIQGTILLSQALHDSDIILQQMRVVRTWIRTNTQTTGQS